MYRFIFTPDVRGYGDLQLYDDNRFQMSYLVRTGSINSMGKLINSISFAEWEIRKEHPPVDTSEVGMWIKEGMGWKVPLCMDGQRTHFLVHPDGNKPGTLGCLGLQKTDAREFKEKICKILESQDSIKVHVLKEGQMQNLIKTKTFWGGVAGIVSGIGLIVGGDVGNGVTAIIMGIVAITGRDAIAKIGK